MKLRYAADLRSLAFVAVYFGLVAYQWFGGPVDLHTLDFTATELGIAIALFGATCVFSFFGAVITHNTIHCPVWTSRAVNRVFQALLSLTYGSAVSAFVPGHNLSHHKHTQTKRDVMRTTKVRHSWHLLNMVEFAPRVGIAIMKNDAAYTKAMKGSHRAWFRQYQIETATVFGVTIGLFLVDWRKALVYWFVPHLYAAWGIISMNYLQHDGCDPDHPYNHSRNFVGKFVNWWTFNNGYHGVHHGKPGLHWSLLPAEHARVLGPFIHPELDQKSMFVYLVKTFVWPARRKNYDGSEMVLPEEGPDESWIPRPEETPEDLGAVAVG